MYAPSLSCALRVTARAQVSTDAESMGMQYRYGDNDGRRQAFGLWPDDVMNQEMGSIVVQQGKCVVLPKVYKFCVLQFELVDETSVGD